MSNNKDKGKNCNPVGYFRLCQFLDGKNLTDAERRRILVLLTECMAAALKVNVKISN